MQFIKKWSVIVGSAALLFAGTMNQAVAGLIVFDFTGPRASLGPSETFTVGGLSVDVMSTGGDVHRNGGGLGVTGNPDRNRLGSGSSTNREALSFTFSSPIKLIDALVWEHRNGTEQFDIEDGAGSVLGSYSISGGANNASTVVALTSLNFSGDTLVFRHSAGSGIRINALTVSEVPVPATAALMAASLAAFGATRRRRRLA